jgi:clan AA aspartic protease
MLIGTVNSLLEATVSLVLRSPRGQRLEVEAVVDTGYDGTLTLPSDLIAALELPFIRRGRVILGDGSESLFDVYQATVFWNGRPRKIAVDSADTEPLLGMKLLYGSELTVQVIEGGSVRVRELPMA